MKTGRLNIGTGMGAQATAFVSGMTSTQRTWETLKSHDVGLDVTVLGNRLSATFDWFQKTKDGMFIPVT